MIAIAIDGPAGAGKSTIARAVAEQLGYIYVDTGALYRTIGLYMLRNGISIEDPLAIEENILNVKIDLAFVDGNQRVVLCGDDVTDCIRTPEVSMAASAVSAVPKVREALLELQKSIAKKNNVVMDGRDIGTVVLPDAQVKIFLTASLEERARRRCTELQQKGTPTEYNEVIDDMKQRDYQDSNRAIAPLKPAADSVIIDTSKLDLKQSIEKMMSIINQNLSK